jgi:hypothetical protein
MGKPVVRSLSALQRDSYVHFLCLICAFETYFSVTNVFFRFITECKRRPTVIRSGKGSKNGHPLGGGFCCLGLFIPISDAPVGSAETVLADDEGSISLRTGHLRQNASHSVLP